MRGGYHYPGKSYVARFDHVPSASTCVACHDAHTTQVATESCLSCHRGVEDIRDIRTRHQDFDGDGDNAVGIHAEIVGLHGQLYAAIQAYGTETSNAPIGYAYGTFPYFFNDTNSDRQISADEAIFPNRYQSWTPRLLKAAYNYQVVQKDPGGYVHNPTCLLQLLYASLASLSVRVDVDMSVLRRPCTLQNGPHGSHRGFGTTRISLKRFVFNLIHILRHEGSSSILPVRTCCRYRRGL
jgi:hypothetical protein